MFHIDVTLEDTRVIAVENRVPLEGEELKSAQVMNEYRATVPETKMDGFKVTLVDNVTGHREVVILTHEELAEGLRIAISGDDSEHAYDNPHVKSLCKKLERIPAECRFIP